MRLIAAALLACGWPLAAQDPVADLVQSAQRHEARREHAQAIADFEQILKLRPKWADAFNHRGAEHFKMAHIRQSLADCPYMLKLSRSRSMAPGGGRHSGT